MNYRGKRALVTGASAGIGEAFARALAGKGADLVLTARRADRLTALAEDLRSSAGVKVTTVAADLADPGAPDAILTAAAEAGPVDILVNNAGYGLPGYFSESDWSAHHDFLEVMVTSYARLTHALTPGMVERGFGRIIQVSSVAGLTPGSAGHTLYGPAKAFLVSFAQSIAAECDGTGVHSTALCPGFTYTEFHDVNGTRKLVSLLPKRMFMAVEPVVEGAIEAVERGHVVYVPGAWNKFLVGVVKAMPRPWAAQMMKEQSSKFRRRKSA
ncbi:MAG: SDR family oxidoreductase [Pseudomonadota bacterium]